MSQRENQFDDRLGEAMSPAYPTATFEALKLRAGMLGIVRAFLSGRGYFEVETPLLSHDTVVDCYLDPIEVPVKAGDLFAEDATLYLQTSPELAMKRLLAAGSGSIFQVARAFRLGERSPRHNPEFTLIEWYRVDGDYRELMAEVGLLVQELLAVPEPVALTYREAFQHFANTDPFTAETTSLQSLAANHGFQAKDRDELLNFLLASLVEPNLGKEIPCFLYDYPASQAALAEVDPGPPAIARRFELYIDGQEICNGYQELRDAAELRRRNHENNRKRVAQGKAALPVDSRMLQVTDQLPRCAGVAVGFDRLVMLAAKASTIDAVIPFPIERA